MQRFTIPRDVYFGTNALDHLKDVKGTKAMLVIDSERLIEDGTVSRIQDLLKEARIETTVFSGVESDPSVSTVKKGVEMMTSFEPDLIIGIGGGSPIDAAKAMWIFYEYPNLTFKEAAKPFSLPELRQKAKFIAIPTTSGTGSEVTSFSVITDNETNIKYPIADYNITPDVAIVDPALVESMPPELVANTGMDALTHAFEAYVSTARNPITDSLAMKSIEMTVKNLINSFNGEKEARENMHISQCLAGMAFSNAILGIAHSMAHKTGKIFNIAHGSANSIYLPSVIEFNSKTAGSAYADIAKRLGLDGNTTDKLVKSLIKLVKDFRVAMNMPQTLNEYGLSEDFFKEHLDEISKTAVADPCTGTNPRQISVEEMKKLFETTYYGTEVNF
ncbi:iron-containing alcohol dehydrogenase [Clostridium sp. D2Q-14]|uniref:iron-containing alcohol dehydrogenase n=1 Tax=Anaeromonas gelatinilytica TaxID=2683194 RepID=UPI00193B823F|nr:iron-containing alcohol dehydrogenase [Anaeromonas gelatinilytica]MBS4534633.1 iron-containing alcohol dehydrogenase [Anaeromonas gelatinilytica]